MHLILKHKISSDFKYHYNETMLSKLQDKLNETFKHVQNSIEHYILI